MRREGLKNKESFFSFEDPAFYEKRDLGGVEVSFPKQEVLGRLFAGKGFSPEGRAFAQEFFKKITHEAPKEDQDSLFEVVHSLLSDEGEEGILKKLLHQSAKLRFKPLESKRSVVEEKKEISLEDPSFYERRNLGGVEVTLPKESALEQLFSGKGFSSEGRKFAKHFFGEVMHEVPEEFDVQDIQDFFKTVCDQLPQGGKEGLLRKFLYQSAKFRLEHVEKIKHVEELQASNSPLAGLLASLQSRYEKHPSKFSHNFIAASVVGVKKSLNRLGADMVKKEWMMLPEGVERGVLNAFLEDKFSQALRDELEVSPTATLKEVVSKTMASLDTAPLSKEFREQILRTLSLTAIEEAIASSQTLSRENTTIVFEEHIRVVRDEEVLEEEPVANVLQDDVDLEPNRPEIEIVNERTIEDGSVFETPEETLRVEEVPLSQIILDSRGIPHVREEVLSSEALEREELENEIGYFVKLRARSFTQFVDELTEIEALSKPYNTKFGDYADEKLRAIRDSHYPGWEPKRFGSLFREVLRRVGETEATFYDEKRMVGVGEQEREEVGQVQRSQWLASEIQMAEEVSSLEAGTPRVSREVVKKGEWLKRLLGKKLGTKVGLFIASAAVLFSTYGAGVPKTNTINQVPTPPQDSSISRRVLTEEKRETIKSVAVEKDEQHIGSYYYKFKGEASEKNKNVVLSVSIPRVDIDTTRWHKATGEEGFDKTGPMDRPSIYVGGNASGTEFEGGLSWDRVYDKEGKPTEEFAYRIFLRAPGVSPMGWINPKVGSKDNVYFRQGEKIKLSMERRGPGTMVLVVRGESGDPVEMPFSLSDTSSPSYKYVIAIDQFVENEITGLREGNEGRRAKPTRTTISNLNIEGARVELEDGTTHSLGFFSSHNTVIVPGDVVPPPFRISRVNPQTGAFSCTIDTQGPSIAGVGVVESQ